MEAPAVFQNDVDTVYGVVGLYGNIWTSSFHDADGSRQKILGSRHDDSHAQAALTFCDTLGKIDTMLPCTANYDFRHLIGNGPQTLIGIPAFRIDYSLPLRIFENSLGYALNYCFHKISSVLSIKSFFTYFKGKDTNNYRNSKQTCTFLYTLH